MDIEIKRPGALTDGEIAAWRALQAGDPSLASPYFAPEFAQCVDAVRCDARVAIVREAGEIIAFWAFQSGPLGCGRPIGGPLSDFHGLVAARKAEIDVQSLASRAGLAVYGFHFTPAGQARHGFGGTPQDPCHVMALENGYEAYRALAEQETGAFKTMDNRRRRMERDFETVEVVIDDRSEAAFETLIAWKRAQFAATGYFDIFSVGWTGALLETLRRRDSEEFRGLLSSLYLDGRLAAVHFGMQAGRALHYWFPAYDPEFNRYSAGNVLLDDLARASQSFGWSEIHLGPGDYRYKREFATRQDALIKGVLRTASLAGAAHAGATGLQSAFSSAGLDPLARLTSKALRWLDRQAAFRPG